MKNQKRAWALPLLLLSVSASAQVESMFLGGSQESLTLQPSTQLSTPAVQQTPNYAPTPPPPPVERKIDHSVYGSHLFKGHFAANTFQGFNPDYQIGTGDVIDLKLWGAVEAVLRLVVDAQGNIFVPKLGPINLQNVRNGEVNDFVRKRVKQVFRENVGVYASLANAEPVKVYVTGYVNEPGLYGAYSSDSVLHFLDRAGGIDTDTGSFLDVQIKRNGKLHKRINLYDFLANGDLPLLQFHDGDVILVGPLKSTARVDGVVNLPKRFEFDGQIPLRDLLALAGIQQQATHVRVLRNQRVKTESELFALDEDLSPIRIVSGDDVRVIEDRRAATILAEIDGEYAGLGQYVLPYDANLSDLLAEVSFTPLSDQQGIRLFRRSVAKRQKEVLEQMLQKLEQSVLTARPGTREEAQLRTQEAELILRFVERARKIEPEGRVVLRQGFDPSLINLQDKDLIRIPRKTNTVAVQGEVFFPSSFIWQKGHSAFDYIKQAGGLSQRGSQNRIFVVRSNGEMIQVTEGWFQSVDVLPGDEIMVLPQVDSKEFQFSKDLVQIIYQLALSAGVVLRL